MQTKPPTEKQIKSHAKGNPVHFFSGDKGGPLLPSP